MAGCCSHQGRLCPRQSQKVPLLEAESRASSRRTPRTLSSTVTGPCQTQGHGEKKKSGKPPSRPAPQPQPRAGWDAPAGAGWERLEVLSQPWAAALHNGTHPNLGAVRTEVNFTAPNKKVIHLFTPQASDAARGCLFPTSPASPWHGQRRIWGDDGPGVCGVLGLLGRQNLGCSSPAGAECRPGVPSADIGVGN